MSQDRTPEPPYPPNRAQRPPGEERTLSPRPRYEAPDYRAAGKLEGKRALITGGDSGIGRAVAVLFAREGADVAIVSLPEERADAEETKRAVEAAGRRCVSLEGDVRDPAFCHDAVETCVERLGGLDVLVNNAAFQNHVEGIDALDFEQWDRTFKTNVYGYFYMAKAALKYLPRGGVILQTGSITGLEGSPGLLDYSATKGAIHAFTKALAQSVLERGVRVNCVAPGPVWTPLNPAERSAEETARFGEGQPYGRPAQPEEIAPAYVYFASDADSRYVTGEILTLLGGQVRAA